MKSVKNQVLGQDAALGISQQVRNQVWYEVRNQLVGQVDQIGFRVTNQVWNKLNEVS